MFCCVTPFQPSYWVCRKTTWYPVRLGMFFIILMDPRDKLNCYQIISGQYVVRYKVMLIWFEARTHEHHHLLLDRSDPINYISIHLPIISSINRLLFKNGRECLNMVKCLPEDDFFKTVQLLKPEYLVCYHIRQIKAANTYSTLQFRSWNLGLFVIFAWKMTKTINHLSI